MVKKMVLERKKTMPMTHIMKDILNRGYITDRESSTQIIINVFSKASGKMVKKYQELKFFRMAIPMRGNIKMVNSRAEAVCIIVA